MNRTKIEWVRNPDGKQRYTRNPIKGICKNNCWYCYAKKMYKRFNWNPEIRLDIDIMKDIDNIKEPSTFFIGSMHDIFGDWISIDWIKEIIFWVAVLPSWHTFIFLTKFPARYKDFNFPKNCWLGVTITGEENIDELGKKMWNFTVLNNNLKFISYEPLLNSSVYYSQYISVVDWIIIGGLTPKPRHKKEWIEDIIKQARFWGKPIFIKDNLKWHERIQEFPNVNKK